MPAVPSPFRPRKPKVEPPSKSKMNVPVERAIEHCRVFVDGEALPGEFTVHSALEAVEEYGRGFVWVGLVEPVENQMTRVAEQFGIHELIGREMRVVVISAPNWSAMTIKSLWSHDL